MKGDKDLNPCSVGLNMDQDDVNGRGLSVPVHDGRTSRTHIQFVLNTVAMRKKRQLA